MAKPARRGNEIEKKLKAHIDCKSRIGNEIMNFIENTLNFDCKVLHTVKPPVRSRPKVDLIINCEGKEILLSIKSFNPNADYNHVDRAFIEKYDWEVPEDVYKALKLFVGEVSSENKPLSHSAFLEEVKKLTLDKIVQEIESKITDYRERDNIKSEINKKGISPGLVGKIRRRTFSQMKRENPELVKKVIDFFSNKKEEIIKSVLIDNEPIDKFFFIIAEIKNDETICYYIITAKSLIDIYTQGDIRITSEGNLLIGKVEMQRKGGNHWNGEDWNDDKANQLQFKIRPSEIIKSGKAKKIGCEEL